MSKTIKTNKNLILFFMSNNECIQIKVILISKQKIQSIISIWEQKYISTEKLNIKIRDKFSIQWYKIVLKHDKLVSFLFKLILNYLYWNFAGLEQIQNYRRIGFTTLIIWLLDSYVVHWIPSIEFLKKNYIKLRILSLPEWTGQVQMTLASSWSEIQLRQM